MRTNSRDLGLNHGPGKGDADRSDRKKFVEGIRRVKGIGNKADTDATFKRAGLKRWTKSYK
jgi:hypothetical protein